MAQGYGEDGPPSRGGGSDGWSPPRRIRPARGEEPWAPGWGPAPDQAVPRAGYPDDDDTGGLSGGFDPFPEQAYRPTTDRGDERARGGWVGPPDNAHDTGDQGQPWPGQPGFPDQVRPGGRAVGGGRPDPSGRIPAGGRPDAGSRPDAAPFNGFGGRPAFGGRPDIAGRPDISGRPDITGRPDIAGGPGIAGRPDIDRRSDVLGRPGRGVRPDLGGRPDLGRRPGGDGRPAGWDQRDDFGRRDRFDETGRWDSGITDVRPGDTDWRGFTAAPVRSAGAGYAGAPNLAPAAAPTRPGLPRQSGPAIRATPFGAASRPPIRPAPDLPDDPERHTGRTILIAILVVIVLTGGAYGVDRWNHHRITAVTTTSKPVVLPAGDPITSQKTDPEPLTTAEVFGASTIPSSAGGGGYSVVKSESVACASVATDKIATLLNSLGCTQAVRATLTTSDHTYVITAGVVNLPDSSAAANARTSLKSLISAGTGRFISLDASGVPSVSQVTTHLGWDSRGHYLSYAVIALANGQPISATDDRTASIINDIVERYLGATVIGARETQPSATPSK
jgi:hypothetical protein